jgi:Na+-driven multidrug efflux pump
MFGASTMIGFGQGFQPFCGFNYGAGLYSRVKKGFWFCIKVSASFLLVAGGVVFAFAPQIVAIFRDDPEVIRIGTTALRFQCLTFPTHSWIVMSTMMEQVMGRTGSATFLSVARQGMFFIPAVLILSSLLGILGIQMTQTVADILTLLCAIPIHYLVLRSLPRQDLSKA